MPPAPLVLATCAWFLASAAAIADDADVPGRETPIRAAAERGLLLVQRAAASYPEHRQCFSCHHQTLPMLAMAEARDAGLKTDEELLQSQLAFTRTSFNRRRDQLEQGGRIGGRSATVTYGLWALRIAGDDADGLTDAMLQYLLKRQDESGLWKAQSNRPPLEESRVTFTTLAVYALQEYARGDRKTAAEGAIAQARAFLADAPTESNEDFVFRLWGLSLLEAEEAEIESARQAVLGRQRDDGGWSQLPDMPGDAYATGQALFVLHETGMPASAEEFRRGIDFLLRTQRDDGSWHVKTRSRPVQVFFDNGDPHGKDQFISTPATAWAVAALCRALPAESAGGE